MTGPLFFQAATSTAPLFSPMRAMGLIVLAVLCLASAVTALLERARPGLALDEVKTKIKSWWVMGGVFFLAVALGSRPALLLVALICYLALKEYFTLIPTTLADRGALAWSYLMIPIQFLWIDQGWFGMFAVFIPVYVFLFIPARQILAGETSHFVARTGSVIWGALLFVFFLSHMGFLLALGRVGEISGREMLLYLVFLTELNDVSAFVTGKTLGRRPISPTVSPNKTWGGFVGGVVCTTLLAIGLRFLTPFTLGQAAFCGLGIAVSGFFGDLCVSAVKRDVGVKDSSDFIPGHGGVLDRIDSLTYTAPLFLHYVRWLYY